MNIFSTEDKQVNKKAKVLKFEDWGKKVQGFLTWRRRGGRELIPPLHRRW